MSAQLVEPQDLSSLSDRLRTVEALRDRIHAAQGGPARLPVPTHPLLADLVQLRTGGCYGVDSAFLALVAAAGASRAGEWVGFAGWSDFGAQAAQDLGIDLSRTVLVPEPGEHWLEVAAALVDVLKVVVLRTPFGGVDPKAASVLEARLRARSAALVVWGDWPRCEARISADEVRWTGLGQGQGRLQERRVRVACRRGAAPPVSRELAIA